jgi:hypothetical protein
VLPFFTARATRTGASLNEADGLRAGQAGARRGPRPPAACPSTSSPATASRGRRAPSSTASTSRGCMGPRHRDALREAYAEVIRGAGTVF